VENQLLNLTIYNDRAICTPVRQYIQKLTTGTEQLQTKSIIHQHDANNFRSIIKKCTTRTKGKTVILKGHFYIFTQELCDAALEAEKATKKLPRKRGERRERILRRILKVKRILKKKMQTQLRVKLGIVL